MEYEDYIKIKAEEAEAKGEQPIEVEINFYSSGASPDGKSAAWSCEVIAHDNGLWVNKEPYYYPFKQDPDRIEVQKDFFTDRKKFKLLGDYYREKKPY
jgi:hypothetical protein